MALSTQQILLLENLTYLPDCDLTALASGTTVRDLLNAYSAQSEHHYGSYMDAAEWTDLVTAIQNDPQLLNVQLVSAQTDIAPGGGDGLSALFTDPSSGEAVVAFCGTAGREWKDDFLGGTVTAGSKDGVSTIQQENALAWYQSLKLDDYSSITVTGHSKGGNKAKYITVMDDSVTRCVSFDGQGFSDEFIQQYTDKIALAQNKISNHNTDYDYVNLLLNDIGSKTFYAGNNIGEGGIVENHCPNAFFSFDENGNPVMTETPRPAEMEALDHYLNSMLRSLPEEQQQDILNMFGDIAESSLGRPSGASALDILLNSENQGNTAYVLASIAYIKEHPEAADSLQSVMEKFGMEDGSELVEMVTAVLDSKAFPALAALFGAGGLTLTQLPDGILAIIAAILSAETGITLSGANLDAFGMVLFHTFFTLSVYPGIDAADNGADLTVNTAAIDGIAQFSICPPALADGIASFQTSAGRIANISQELLTIAGEMDGILELLLRLKLTNRANTIAHYSEISLRLAAVLEDILTEYQKSELSVVQQFS